MRFVRLIGLGALLGAVLIMPDAVGPLTASAVWVLCVVVHARSSQNGILSLGAVYLLLLGLFHLGVVAPLALGLTEGPAPSWLRSPYLPTTLQLFALAVLAFTLGASLRARTPLGAGPPAAVSPHRTLFWVGCLVAGLGATLLWIAVLTLGILSADYSTYYERAMTEDVRFFGFGLMLFPIGLLVAAVGARPRQMPILAAFAAVVLGPLFVSGFRGPPIVQGASLLAVWAYKDRRLARRIALVAAVAVLVVAPLIRASRNSADGSAGGSVRPLDVVDEAGWSLRALVVTVEQIESRSEPLWMGSSYAEAVRRILPNVSTRWTAPSGGLRSPSMWVTMHADPWAYDHAGGIGFSGVAEPYLNFGTLGVMLIFALLGVILASWERSLAGRPFPAAIGGATFGFILFTVRNEVIELFRAFAFALATVLCAWILVRANAWRSARRNDEDPASAMPDPR